MKIENAKAQMKKGVLELCILAAIAGEEEAYPSDILQKLKEADLLVVEGTLYPLLSRLKDDGLLEYTWRESRSGPPRKYYRSTEEGRAFLAELNSAWLDLVKTVDEALRRSGGIDKIIKSDQPAIRMEKTTEKAAESQPSDSANDAVEPEENNIV